MNKNRFKRIMAYVYMPLFFLLLGYGIVYFAFQPYISIAVSISKIVVSDVQYDYAKEMTSIYNPDLLDEDVIRGEEIDISLLTLPFYEEEFGEIYCERIDLWAPLYYGDNLKTTLRWGAGMYDRSQLPGFGGTTLVAGHNHTYFAPFENLEVGDIITIRTSYGIYEYEVSDMQVLLADDPEAFDLYQDDQEVLVAYTCYPFTAITEYTDYRLFVRAEKISGPEVVGIYE